MSENCSVKRCSCKDKFQDKRYGHKLRLHNKTLKHPTSSGGWRCTVCGKEKS
jgi:hypothetical protein